MPMPPVMTKKEGESRGHLQTQALGEGTRMADPMADMDELLAINDDRTAAGLEPLNDIDAAREWKKQQVKVAPKAEVETVTQTQEETAKSAVTVPTVPSAKQEVTDGRVAELEKELQRLKSEQGRSSVLAKTLHDVEAERDAAVKRAEQAEAAAQEAVRKARGGGFLASLTAEQRDGIDEGALPTLEAMDRHFQEQMRVALAAVEERAASGIAETRQELEARKLAEQARESQAQQERTAAMWNEVGALIPPSVYGTFTSNPKWAEWCNSKYAGVENGTLFTSATVTADKSSVIDLLERFMRYAGITVPTKGVVPPVRVDESRGSGGVEKPMPQEFYADDVQRMYDLDVQGKLGSEWTPAKLDKYFGDVEKARHEGRIKPGRAPR